MKNKKAPNNHWTDCKIPVKIKSKLKKKKNSKKNVFDIYFEEKKIELNKNLFINVIKYKILMNK